MKSRLSRSSGHRSTEMIFPTPLQIDLRFSFFRLTFSEKDFIRLFLYKLRTTAITEKAYGYCIFSGFQQSGRNGVDTGRILIRDSPHKCAIYIDRICIYDASQTKSRFLSRLLCRHLKVFTEPVGAIDGIQSVCCPAGSKQICFCPIAIIIIGSIPRGSLMHPFVSLTQRHIPSMTFLPLLFFHRFHQVVRFIDTLFIQIVWKRLQPSLTDPRFYR